MIIKDCWGYVLTLLFIVSWWLLAWAYLLHPSWLIGRWRRIGYHYVFHLDVVCGGDSWLDLVGSTSSRHSVETIVGSLVPWRIGSCSWAIGIHRFPLFGLWVAIQTSFLLWMMMWWWHMGQWLLQVWVVARRHRLNATPTLRPQRHCIGSWWSTLHWTCTYQQIARSPYPIVDEHSWERLPMRWLGSRRRGFWRRRMTCPQSTHKMSLIWRSSHTTCTLVHATL